MLRNLAGCALVTLLIATGCGHQNAGLDADMTAERSRLLMSSEPTGAVSVMDLRETIAGAAQEVVLVGRVGGSKPVFSTNHASFVMVDPAAMPAHTHAEGCGDNCPYCSKGAEDNAVAMIHCVNDRGDAVPVAADRLFDMSEGQTAVVHGHAHLDESGNLIVLADGVYIRR